MELPGLPVLLLCLGCLRAQEGAREEMRVSQEEVMRVSQEEVMRVSCLPESLGAEDQAGDKEKCEARGCEWSPPALDHRAPSCFYPQDYGYRVLGEAETTDHGMRVHLRRKGFNDNVNARTHLRVFRLAILNVWERFRVCDGGF